MDKVQIGLRVLKVNKGTISLPRPSRWDSQANVVRLQTCRLHWNSSPEGATPAWLLTWPLAHRSVARASQPVGEKRFGLFLWN